jgi:two-component system chemotaxis response regulator CheY
MMKTLIVDDDFTSRLYLQEVLKAYGPVHIAANGKEAVQAVAAAVNSGEPYDLICLDIMMPEMDGQQALTEIRAKEEAKRIPKRARIIMTTALTDPETVTTAIQGKCDYFLAKPIPRAILLDKLRKLALIY